jgi:NitT/TauT family transport system ATP-binding protein
LRRKFICGANLFEEQIYLLNAFDLTKRFGDRVIFEDLDLGVPRGRFAALVGPSGCGKSTLFNVLTGAVARSGGSIEWMGRRLPSLETAAAYMHQKDLLLPWMTLLDNALLPAVIAGRNRTESVQKAAALFERFGLAGYEQIPPAQASGGMRQRCALVRTLMFDRELVLLDEPLSALDAITRSGLQGVLHLLQKDFSKTILMITHDVEEALLLADEVWICSRAPMRILDRIEPPGEKPRKAEDPELVEARSRILQRLQKEAADADR